jgi:hypothetical protein
LRLFDCVEVQPPAQMRKWVVKSSERSVAAPVKETSNVLIDSNDPPPSATTKNSHNNNKFFQTYHGPKMSRGDSLVKDRVHRFSEQITRSNSKEIYRKKADSNKEFCVANVDVDSAKEGDLSFKMGDLLLIVEKHPNGWWECELNGIKGWVSCKYVREMRSRSVTDFM